MTIAIDDFGTGFSSLAKLHGLPVQQLKVDRSFVHGMAGDEERQQVVRAVVQLADALSLDVVAEGVESDDELQVLQRLGCPHAQGFGLARPAPVDDVAALLRRGLLAASARVAVAH